MTQMKDTKLAQHFTVPMFRLVWQIIAGVIGVLAIWYALVGDVRTNAQDIFVNKEHITENKDNLNSHLIDMRGQPLSELELQLKVGNIEDDVKDHNIKITNHDSRIVTNEILVGVMRGDQKIIKDDIKEILKILKPNK